MNGDSEAVAVPHVHRRKRYRRAPHEPKKKASFDAPKEVPNLMAKRRFDYLVQNNYADLPYVQKWLKQPWITEIRQDINFYSFLNHSTLKKEMTESWSVYKQVKKMVMKLEAEYGGCSEKQICVFDICSGKGFFSTLLALKMPDVKIFMVDHDKQMNVNQVKSLPNVDMVYMDIFSPKFDSWLKDVTQNYIGVFVGTHLCGDLSTHFISKYNRIATIKAMVLAPCCLSKKKKELTAAAKRLNVDNYVYWTLFLYHMVLLSQKDISYDDNVISTKNGFICAAKTTL